MATEQFRYSVLLLAHLLACLLLSFLFFHLPKKLEETMTIMMIITTKLSICALPPHCPLLAIAQITDNIATVGYVLEAFSEFTPLQLLTSDLDQDGTINVTDIIALVNCILGSDTGCVCDE